MPVAQPFLNTPGQVGALAGYSDGMRMSYGLADLDREFRDRDLANKSNTLKYEEDLANVPLNEATRGVKMGMAGIDQALIDQGLVEQAKKDEFALKGYQAEEGRQKVDENTRRERAEAVQEGIQILKNPSLANSDTWTEYYNKMTEKHKMRGLSPNFQDPKNGALLNAANQAYVNSAPHQRNMEAIEEKGDYARELAKIRADASAANTDKLIADREVSKWAALPADKQARELASREMQATGGAVSVPTLKAVAETLEKKDSKSVLDLAKEKKSDLRRKYADKGISNEMIADMALKEAKKEYDEDSMVRAWSSLGSPKIPEPDLKDLEQSMPNFVTMVRGLDKVAKDSNGKDLFINRPDPSSVQGASKPTISQAPVSTGNGLASATAQEKTVIAKAKLRPEYAGFSDEQLLVAARNLIASQSKKALAPQAAPVANDVPGMPTGDLRSEPPRTPLPPVMRGMEPQTPAQWLGRE